MLLDLSKEGWNGTKLHSALRSGWEKGEQDSFESCEACFSTPGFAASFEHKADVLCIPFIGFATLFDFTPFTEDQGAEPGSQFCEASHEEHHGF